MDREAKLTSLDKQIDNIKAKSRLQGGTRNENGVPTYTSGLSGHNHDQWTRLENAKQALRLRGALEKNPSHSMEPFMKREHGAIRFSRGYRNLTPEKVQSMREEKLTGTERQEIKAQAKETSAQKPLMEKLKDRMDEATAGIKGAYDRLTSKTQTLTSYEVSGRIDKELNRLPAESPNRAMLERVSSTLERRYRGESFEVPKGGDVYRMATSVDHECDRRFFQRNPGPKLGVAIQKEAAERIRDKLHGHEKAEPMHVVMKGSELSRYIEREISERKENGPLNYREPVQELEAYQKSLKGLENANIQVPAYGQGIVVKGRYDLDYGHQMKVRIKEAQARAIPEMQKELAKIQVRAKLLTHTQAPSIQRQAITKAVDRGLSR